MEDLDIFWMVFQCIPQIEVSGSMDPNWNDSSGSILPSPLFLSVNCDHHSSIWQKHAEATS